MTSLGEFWFSDMAVDRYCCGVAQAIVYRYGLYQSLEITEFSEAVNVCREF